MCSLDRVKQRFEATQPNRIWVADFTYVATCRGFVYVVFVIEGFSRRIMGLCVASTPRTDLALDALEQALYDRSRQRLDGLVHYSDRDTEYLSIHYTEGQREAGIEPLEGGVGHSYDNALAESLIGLYKTALIRRRNPWKQLEDVELATLSGFD